MHVQTLLICIGNELQLLDEMTQLLLSENSVCCNGLHVAHSPYLQGGMLQVTWQEQQHYNNVTIVTPRT